MVAAAAQSFRKGVRRALESRQLNFLREHYAGLGSCLVYHRVTASPPNDGAFEPYRGLTVSVERFREQMRYLRDNFLCLDLPSAVKALQKSRLPRRSVVVTFDDGYRDNMTVALPILEEFKIPATIFVSTGLVETGRGLWWYDLQKIIGSQRSLNVVWRGERFAYSLETESEKSAVALHFNELLKALSPSEQREFLTVLNGGIECRGTYTDELLTWRDVQALDRHPLLTIGAHTVSHPVLSALSPDELGEELVESRIELEERLGRPVDLLAYPYGGLGQASVREFRAAQAAGYTAAFTTRFGHIHRPHNQSLQALPRISITDTDTLDDFAEKLSGLTAFIAQRGRRVVTI